MAQDQYRLYHNQYNMYPNLNTVYGKHSVSPSRHSKMQHKVIKSNTQHSVSPAKHCTVYHNPYMALHDIMYHSQDMTLCITVNT